ncbi:hypothetical protein J2D73_17690 [Acetobacter sacchari]|uniref:Uncharacterized protein n=1 Tax=Acetobacter sacchari TaxID=2661687 RepID=A0ABS3M0E7_9PROT|nr:hypothetical protein [Acetobacter sacchari]MBO1361617.1 hypothetical protein [Acetobacter sacchari]
MRDLSDLEVSTISGGGSLLISPTAGGLNALLGNALIGAANTVNAFQDAISPIGVALTAVSGPITGALHQFNDYAIYQASQVVDTIGKALGGTITPEYHYVNEWIKGID